MIRRPPRSTPLYSSAASDVYKRQGHRHRGGPGPHAPGVDAGHALPVRARRPGHWVAEQEWPSPGIHPRSWTLSPGRIDMEEPCDPDGEMSIQSPLSVGLFAGKWCSYAEATDLAHDQREEDGGALVFDSPVLEEDLEILGAPVAELNLSSNK